MGTNELHRFSGQPDDSKLEGVRGSSHKIRSFHTFTNARLRGIDEAQEFCITGHPSVP